MVEPVCTYHLVGRFGDEETKRIQEDQTRVEYVLGFSCILTYEPDALDDKYWPTRNNAQ